MLRVCFEASPNYERRLGNRARIGTALHRTLQSLNQRPIPAETIEELAAETRRRYQAESQEQQHQVTGRPREIRLIWDNERSNKALEAVIAEAIRTQPLGLKVHSASHTQTNSSTGISNQRETLTNALIEVEVEVQSKNNLFHGRIDRAERTEDGIRLVDYKSAFRDDLPERYIRQLQIYAYLWQETRGEWPSEAFVFYPISGQFHNVPVDSGSCLQVATESIELAEKIEKNNKPSDLASPGDVCKVCEFRPWCRPFLAWQASEENQLRAVDRANLGFEGEIITIKLENHYWMLKIAWHNTQVKIIAPQERFPHLANAIAGQSIRAIDINLTGQLFQPTASISNLSEIFIVTN